MIPSFNITSTLSNCTESDIVYTMSATGSVGGNTTFLSFNSITMLMNWYESTNRVAETFTIILTAKISNLNVYLQFIEQDTV